MDDADDAGLITTGAIVTVAVIIKRRNLGVSCFFHLAKTKTLGEKMDHNSKDRSIVVVFTTMYDTEDRPVLQTAFW